MRTKTTSPPAHPRRAHLALQRHPPGDHAHLTPGALRVRPGDGAAPVLRAVPPRGHRAHQQRARRDRAGVGPEHEAHDRLPRRGRLRRARRRPDRRPAGHPVVDPRGPEGAATHPPAPRRVDDLAARAPHRRRARPCCAGLPECWPRWPANEPHLPVARDPQLPHLRLRRDRLQRRHVDGASRPGLARAHRAHRPLGHGTRHRHRTAVPAVPRACPVRRHARRPASQAAAALRDADGPARHRPAAGRSDRDGSRRAVARLCPGSHPGGSPPLSTTRPGRPSSPRWSIPTTCPTPSPSTARRSTSAG